MRPSRITAVILGTFAFFGILATPAQASTEPVVDRAFGLVGAIWGGTMPKSTTDSAVTGALQANGSSQGSQSLNNG
ncbi:hypothetical protein [Streptomyces sp. GS7]|uniref:hypothetical protein n=1 Tax=Streptomyces sp. GS7 TaxID=2692234 RepID=UPI00131784F3|nr:hypothetical protein [Streptomyces sp. GS7]QHC22805.1 hypothetical protein GR130_16575 [Streptomyces sp. GS7]